MTSSFNRGNASSGRQLEAGLNGARWLEPASFAAVLTRSPDARSELEGPSSSVDPSESRPADGQGPTPSSSRSVWAPSLGATDGAMSARDFLDNQDLFPLLPHRPSQIRMQETESAVTSRRRPAPRRRAEVVILSPSPPSDRGQYGTPELEPASEVSADGEDPSNVGDESESDDASMPSLRRASHRGSRRSSIRSHSRSSRPYSPPPELPPTPPPASSRARSPAADGDDDEHTDRMVVLEPSASEIPPPSTRGEENGDENGGLIDTDDDEEIQETLFLTALRNGEASRRRRLQSLAEPTQSHDSATAQSGVPPSASAIRSPLSPSASPPPLRAFADATPLSNDSDAASSFDSGFTGLDIFNEPLGFRRASPERPSSRSTGRVSTSFAQAWRDITEPARAPHSTSGFVHVLFCGADHASSSTSKLRKLPPGFTYSSSSADETEAGGDRKDHEISQGCGALLCVRASDQPMLVMALGGWKRRSPVWTSDAPPVPGAVGMVDGESRRTLKENNETEVCECEKEQFGCLHCGQIVGYLTRPECSRCMHKAHAGHRFRFLKNRVRAAHRRRDSTISSISVSGRRSPRLIRRLPVSRSSRGPAAADLLEAEADDDDEADRYRRRKGVMRWKDAPSMEKDVSDGLAEDPQVWSGGVLVFTGRPPSPSRRPTSLATAGHPDDEDDDEPVSPRARDGHGPSAQREHVERLRQRIAARRRNSLPLSARGGRASPPAAHAHANVHGVMGDSVRRRPSSTLASFFARPGATTGPPVPVLEVGGDDFGDHTEAAEQDADREAGESRRQERAPSTQPLVRGTSLSRTPAMRLPRERGQAGIVSGARRASMSADDRVNPQPAASAPAPSELLGPFPTSHARRTSRLFDADDTPPQPDTAGQPGDGLQSSADGSVPVPPWYGRSPTYLPRPLQPEERADSGVVDPPHPMDRSAADAFGYGTLFNFALQAFRSSQGETQPVRSGDRIGGMSRAQHGREPVEEEGKEERERDEDELWRECWPRQRRRTERDQWSRMVELEGSGVGRGPSTGRFVWTGDVCAR